MQCLKALLVASSLSLGLLSASSTVAQSEVAANPSIADTLDFLVRKLNSSAGAHTLASYTSSGVQKTLNVSWTTSNVSVDLSACSVTYTTQLAISIDGKITSVPAQVVNIYLGRATSIQNFSGDNVTWITLNKTSTFRFTPPTYQVSVNYDNGPGPSLVFMDDADAASVGRAVTHAAKLCGGLKKDLF